MASAIALARFLEAEVIQHLLLCLPWRLLWCFMTHNADLKES